MKYLMYAPHNWTTTEACYSEIVNVVKGYCLVTVEQSRNVMFARGYDTIAKTRDDDPRTLDEFIEIAQKELGHEPSVGSIGAAQMGRPESPYQTNGQPAAAPNY